MRINSERLSAQAYIEFLKRTDLGSQYPRERFEERIDRLVSSIEPAIIVITSVLAGVILLSVMLPLMGLLSSVGSAIGTIVVFPYLLALLK